VFAGGCVADGTNTAVDVGRESEQADRINMAVRARKRRQIFFIRIPLRKSSKFNSNNFECYPLNVRCGLKVP
jgi:hypothetical protein